MCDLGRSLWQGVSELQLLELPCSDPGLLATRSIPAGSPTSGVVFGPEERERGSGVEALDVNDTYVEAVSSFCRRLNCSPRAVCLFVFTSTSVRSWLPHPYTPLRRHSS